MLGEWSPSRQLEPNRLISKNVDEVTRPGQGYVEERILSEAVSSRTDDSGDIAYICDFKLDHRESPETQKCRVTFAPSQYSEVRAIEALRINQPGVMELADQVLARNASEYLRAAVPSSVAVNVVPIAEDGSLLCAQRSAAVDNAVGLWTVGIFETMKRSDPNRPGQPEDFFSLSYRALLEELGLTPRDFGELFVTWVGIYRPILRGHVVATVRLKIAKDEAIDRARQADSSYEHGNYDWIPLNRSTVRMFSGAPAVRDPASAGAVISAGGRNWLEQSRLGVLEAWRFRAALED